MNWIAGNSLYKSSPYKHLTQLPKNIKKKTKEKGTNMTHISRKNHAYNNCDETARTQIKTGYEVM
jgi:hypothetical protein